MLKNRNQAVLKERWETPNAGLHLQKKHSNCALSVDSSPTQFQKTLNAASPNSKGVNGKSKTIPFASQMKANSSPSAVQLSRWNISQIAHQLEEPGEDRPQHIYIKFKEDNGKIPTSKDKTNIVNIIRTWDWKSSLHEFSLQQNWKQISVATFGNFKALQQDQAAEL